MATDSERVRQEIATTRAELTRDVDELARAARHGHLVDRVLRRLRTVKERTIGVAEHAATELTERAQDAGSSVADQLHRTGASAAEKLHDVGDALQQAPRTVGRAAQGSPLGVGLIAFGGGMLAAAMIPETEAERRAAHQLSPHAAPVAAPLQESGHVLAEDARRAAQTAGEHVKTVAADAAHHLRSVAAHGVDDVRTAASDGVADVWSAARDGADDRRSASGGMPPEIGA